MRTRADAREHAPLDTERGGTHSLRRSMAQHIAADLRAAILAGEIAPGTRLNQLKIAAQLDVSTTPVREALRLLEAQGLVRIDTYSGATVPEPTLADLMSLYKIRIALCPLVAESVVLRATDAQLARAREANRQLAASRDESGWLEANWYLHGVLDEAIGDRRLAQVWRELAAVSAIYVNLSLAHRTEERRGAHDEHTRLIDAYANGDATSISEVLIEHLTNTYEGCRVALRDRTATATGAQA
ncbi:MAG: GntR family transcriptional regulator [Acidimicrobiales bacterium]